MKIDLSIIVPCYNRIDLLKETLKSIENAISNINAEIILVDDGSVIPIQEQLHTFVHLPIVHIRQVNSGLTISRYNGLMKAKGEFIQFLDSDDQVASNKFNVQIDAMRINNADISYTDVAEYHVNHASNKLRFDRFMQLERSIVPEIFFIRIQPPPHSPIFKRDYLVNNLSSPFIPLSRNYDSIGEIWFYYNLSIYPAVILKIDEPLTFIIHHDDGRLTDHWELLGICALAIQYKFVNNFPEHLHNSDNIKKMVALAAFGTFRRLPYDMNYQFQNSFLDIWKRLGKSTITDMRGGRYFNILAYACGPILAAKIMKRIKNPKYKRIQTVDDDLMKSELKKVLNNL